MLEPFHVLPIVLPACFQVKGEESWGEKERKEEGERGGNRRMELGLFWDNPSNIHQSTSQAGRP